MTPHIMVFPLKEFPLIETDLFKQADSQKFLRFARGPRYCDWSLTECDRTAAWDERPCVVGPTTGGGI